MALNKHFNVDTYEFEDRPKPKLWLLKPNFQRIERIAGISKLQGTFKYNNLNQLSFQISPTMFDGFQHQQVRNTVFDKIKNKYLIEFQYNNYSDYMVIDDLREVSTDSENIQVVVDSLASELSSKSMNEIEMLGSTIEELSEELTKNYAPLWSLKHVDSKVKDIKRELTMSQGTVMSALEQINTLFDTVIIFDNKNRQFSFYHKDSVGVNRGLRVRENSYLKSFEDSMVSKDIITRLIPMGSEGLTIHSVNPAGSDYIEDFTFFIKPFKRDANRNVIEHSDYMSDELCHALLDYEEFYETRKEEVADFTERYTQILKQHSEEDFKLRSLNGIVQRQEDRIALLKPKSEYVELGIKSSNFNITVEKSSYYLLMLKNEGTLTNIRFDGKLHQLKSGEWTYIKIDTADFQDATKVDNKLSYKIEIVGASTKVKAVLTRSSKDDYDEEDTKKIEEKYNYLKYSQLRDEQASVVSAIERRMKQYEEEKTDLTNSMNPKAFLSEELYREREQFVYSAIWQEDNHTDAQELFDDAVTQLKKQNNVTREVTVGIVNFIQSLEHKEDWHKLNVGDKIVFSNKFFDKKLKAYITEMQIGFDDNNVQLTLSDVFDFKDIDTRISELIAETSSTSTQVNMHKEQIKNSQGKITKMTELIEGEWDANKKRVLAGNETVDIGSHGVKVISNEDPNEFVIMVGGVIAMTKDGGETFKTGVTPEGVNAETLIGKMIIGEDLWLENESGTMRFNKDGLHIDASLFHLTTNDGKEDYFSKLKNELKEETKQVETRIREEYTRKLDSALQESLDVENMVENVSNVLKETFSDGVITDVEKKLINDTLSSLEKENSENVQQIELALNHPYISNDHIVELEQAYTTYEGMYDTLVYSINESIADDIITSDESQRVNEAVVNFRDEVKDIMHLVQEILETTRDNQLQQKIDSSLSYTTRLTKDIKDEVGDLNKAFEETKETIDEAIKDGVFDAAEIESIKTALMIMKSESQDILNRYEQIIANQKLPAEARNRIVKSHREYVAAFKEFNDYVLEMISDGVSDDTERENYQAKFDTLTQKNSVFTQDYTYALQAIALQYTQDAEGKLQEQYDGLKMEITADLKDVRDNMAELENIFDDAFKDGIVTEAEITRLQVHLDMLDREYLDVDERYKTLVNDTRIEQSIRTELASKRSAYASSHSKLRVIINQVIEDRKVTAEEKTQVNNVLSTYNTSFAAFSKVIQTAMNNLSQNLANSAAENKKQEMIDELNKYKETVNNDFTELNGKVDNFEETIWDSFEDQIIETSEAAAINQYINILANEKARIEKQYAVIANNKDLVGSSKTQLSNSYGVLIKSYDSLIETILSAIADNKIIETEKTAVNQKFADYKVKLSDYEDKVNKAIDAIIKNVATSEAEKVNERFESWKSSEFLVESDKIAQRVSGSKWESTYLPQVDGKVNNVKGYIQSRGTNLITNGTGLLNNNENFSGFVFDDSKSFTGTGSFKSVGNNKNIVSDEFIPVDPNRTYRMSYYAQSQTGLGKHYAGVVFYDNDKIQITPYHVYGASNPITKLTKDLKIGDTEIHVESVDGFVDDDGAASHKHSVVLWRYSDSFGHLYEDGTYSRYVHTTAWNNGDIDRTNKIIRLRKPFNLENSLDSEKVFRKGHPISATQSGGSYAYTTTVNANYPTETWERFSGLIGGLSHMGTDKFWYGTNFVKLVFLTNRNSYGGQSGDTSWHSNVVFEDVTGTEKVKEELYTAQDLLNKEVTDVKTKLEDFKTVTNGAFKDGIIEATEAKAIAAQIELLNNEKSDINSKYAQVYNNSNLIGSFKKNLASAKTTYDNSHASLISTINTAISDSKVTSTEKANVDIKFVEYRTSIEALIRRIEEATNSVALKLATDAQNSANSYTNDKVDNLEIGGRNLLQSYKASFGSAVNSDIISTNSFTGSYWATNLYTADYLKNILVEGQTYTYSYEMEITELSAQSVPYGKSHGIIFYSDSIAADRLMTYQSVERVVGNKIKVSKTFVSPKITDHRIIAYSGLYSSDGTTSQPRSSNMVKITNLKLEKGSKVTDWTPAPEDTQSQIDSTNNTLNSYKTTIEANNSFIEQNKNQILSSVSKSEVDATLSKIATYETSYQIKNKAQKTLLEYNGIAFNDNYSYEVVAKTRYDGYDTLAVATFISKGKGKGFELTIIDQKGTTGAHPLFELVNNKPSISLYSNMVTEYVVDVIYTKYLGSASNIERTNSQIKQMSDNITLQVDRIHEELDATNILINSEFNNNAETWTYAYSPDNFTIPDKSEMSINIDGNLILNGFYRDDITGVTTSYRRVTFKLAEPLTVGKTYTLAFNLEVIKGDNNGKMEIYSYSPAGAREVIEVSTINRNTHTFTATAPSTEILIYNGLSGTSENVNTDVALSKVTLIEGTKPLPYRYGSSKNVAKMQYTNNINYPSLISNYISVGKAGELSVGDTITCSSYVYVPSSAKGKLTGLIYFSIATYESNKQTSNPNSGIFSLSPSDIIYDTWVRYSFTTTIPASSSNGKTNYLRMLLRFDGNEQAVDKDVVFYYGLPQLELDASPTRWTPSKVDALSTEALASKIALNPESIDIISENLNINTDVLTIKNTNGNLMMKGDTLSVSNNNNSNQVKINSNGISIKKDGMNKMIDGLDRGAQSVFPYQPRMPSYTKATSTKNAVAHVSDSISEFDASPYYKLYWSTYTMGKQEGNLIGSNKDHGRVNRYTLFHEKRYLKVATTCQTDGVNLYVKIDKDNINLTTARIDSSSNTTFPYLIADLGSPSYKEITIEVTMGITGGSRGGDNGSLRIRSMNLSDYKD